MNEHTTTDYCFHTSFSPSPMMQEEDQRGE